MNPTASTPGSRDALLKSRPRRIEPVTIPDDFPDAEVAGRTYFVRALTVGEKGRFDQQFLRRVKGDWKSDPEKTRQMRQRLLIATVVDADGTLLLTERDLPALTELDGGLAEMLVDAAMKLNKVNAADYEKNSDETTAAG